MRIAILGPYTIDSETKGGVERHTQYIVDEFDNSGLDVHVFSISKYGENSIQKIRNNITIHIIKSLKLPMTTTGVSTDLYNLVKEVKKIQPDLVHGQMVGAPYGIATYFLSKNYPSILTVHTLISQNSKIKRTFKSKLHDALWHYLEKIEIRNIQYIITVSEHLKPEIFLMGGSKVYTISNGIAPEWLKIEPKTIEGRILFVGRILPIKGLENLIKAIYHAKKYNEDISLHIVGPYLDAGYFNYLKLLISDLDITNNVFFTGPLYDHRLFKEYSESQIFVLASHDESNPFVLIEAMAAGIPVIATNVGGIPYIVSEDENGFLVRDNDVVDLSKKIVYLLSQNDVWGCISEKNREKAKLYIWNSVASQTVELYKKAIDESRGRSWK